MAIGLSMSVAIELEELSQSVKALVACLSVTGVLRKEAYQVHLHNQNFERIRLRHPCSLELALPDVFNSRASVPADCARFLRIPDVGALTGASRSIKLAFEDAGVTAASASLKLYVCGGTNDVQPVLNYVECYNPISGRWEDARPMREPRARGTAAVLGSECLYVVGGGSMNSVERLNLRTGEWQAAPKTLQSRLGAAGAIFDGYLYLCGGNDHSRTLRTVERFKHTGSGDRWETVPPMIQPRAYASAVTVAQTLYVCGGVLRGQPSNYVQNLCHPHARAWEEAPIMLEPRAYAAAADVLGSILLCGGQGFAEPLRTVEQFDPRVGAWIAAQPMLLPRIFPSAGVLHESLYVCGGFLNGAATDTMERYDPATGFWELAPPMKQPRGFAAAASFGGFA